LTRGAGRLQCGSVLSKALARVTDESYALLRALSGLMFSFHGMQKIFGVFASHPTEVGSQIWIGGVIEVVAGIAVAIGLFTSCAAFLASGTMAVAYVQFHWRFGFGKEFLPAINKGELALVYALVFLYVACRGAGRFSIDTLRGARVET
jgi:putative oxidoreductase